MPAEITVAIYSLITGCALFAAVIFYLIIRKE